MPLYKSLIFLILLLVSSSSSDTFTLSKYAVQHVTLWRCIGHNKGRFTHNTPRPCRSPAKPCREVFRKCLSHLIHAVRPCLIHTCHAAPIPSPTMPWPSRKGLLTNCPSSASSSYNAEFHEVLIRRIPIFDAGGQCETKHRLSWTRKRVVAAHYKKDDVTQFGHFRLPCGHSRRTRHCRSRAGARHGVCELTHGMGAACSVELRRHDGQYPTLL